MDADGATLLNRVVPPAPADRRQLFAEVLARGPAVALFEEPAALDDGLPEAAVAAGLDAAYVPGAAPRRRRDFQPGRPREVGRLATLLAGEARGRPDLLRALLPTPAPALVERDRFLHRDNVRYLGQLRMFLEQRYPELAAVLGPHLDQPAVLALLERYSTPDDLRAAGRRRLRTVLRQHAPDVADALLESLLAALAQPDSARELPNVERVIPNRAHALRLNLEERATLSDDYAALLPPHPLGGAEQNQSTTRP